VLKSPRTVKHWEFRIFDAQGKLFRLIEGRGNPPETIVWDGKGDRGEALISGTIHQASFRVADPLGNEAENPETLSFRAVFR
jgi:hypothetical protein